MTANYLPKQKEDSAMASWLVKWIFWITCLTVVSYAFPSIDGNGTARYFNKFGYLEETADQETLDIRDHVAVLTAIKDSDEFAGLSEIDVLNNGTVKMMNVSRCDVKNKTGDCVRNKRSVRRDHPYFCADTSLDTITRIKNGNTYLFKGNLYWKLFNHVIPEGYPKNISNDWGGLPGDLDAAYTNHKGVTHFFKGSELWSYINKQKQPGYPKQISVEYPGIPNDVDAILSLKNDKEIYFFKGTEYWVSDATKEPPVTPDYPKSISEKWGPVLKDGIDAAFRWQDARVYFFKDRNYYNYNYQTLEVVEHNPPYPLPTGPVWFDCR